MSGSDGNWLDVGFLADIPRRGARQVLTPWFAVALFRTADICVFAPEAAAQKVPLSQGIVHGASTCPLHNWVTLKAHLCGDQLRARAAGEECRPAVTARPARRRGGAA